MRVFNVIKWLNLSKTKFIMKHIDDNNSFTNDMSISASFSIFPEKRWIAAF